MHDGRAEKFRFNGIDSPENRQAYGNRAKQFVSTLAFGKEVKVDVKGRTATSGPLLASSCRTEET